MITTAAMNEAAKSAWYREYGVYPAELDKWRAICTTALADPEDARASPQATRASAKRIKELGRELLRKDRALAETAALLVLSITPLVMLPRPDGKKHRPSYIEQCQTVTVNFLEAHVPVKKPGLWEICGLSCGGAWCDGVAAVERLLLDASNWRLRPVAVIALIVPGDGFGHVAAARRG